MWSGTMWTVTRLRTFAMQRIVGLQSTEGDLFKAGGLSTYR